MSELFDDRQSFEPVPRPDQPNWVNEYFHQIDEILHQLETTIIEPTHVEPFRKYDGQLIFADGTDFNPYGGRGLYFWNSLKPGWVLIAPHGAIVITGAEFVDQVPAGLDLPIQITFGAGDGGPSEPLTLDALGATTCNVAARYQFSVNLQYGRIGAAGQTAELFFRPLLNGLAIGNSLFAKLENPNADVPVQFEATFPLDVGDVVTFEFYRDSTGNDSGELRTNVSTIGWVSSPSASITILTVG